MVYILPWSFAKYSPLSSPSLPLLFSLFPSFLFPALPLSFPLSLPLFFFLSLSLPFSLSLSLSLSPFLPLPLPLPLSLSLSPSPFFFLFPTFAVLWRPGQVFECVEARGGKQKREPLKTESSSIRSTFRGVCVCVCVCVCVHYWLGKISELTVFWKEKNVHFVWIFKLQMYI